MSIYHTGWYDSSRAEETDIAFRRNAEVIVPRRLDLSALRYIYCRSVAERETLLYLLESDLRDRYVRYIIASTRSDLFYRRRTFIETARLKPGEARFQFSPDTRSPGPFHLHIDIVAEANEYLFDDENFDLRPPHIFVLSYPRCLTDYTIQLCLDDHLAYCSNYQETTIPF
jgi:hypothetical protein